jgi:hypothetical protein
MTRATDRRAVLGAALAAGALASLPSAATASVAPSHHPDAELLALIERAKTADSLSTDAYLAAADVLCEMEPSFPQALIWTETDEPPHWYRVRPGERVLDKASTS